MISELQKMILDYFEEYRKTKNNLDELNNKIKMHSQKYHEMCDEKNKIEREIFNMQRVITHMIDNNCDPFAAKLSINEHDVGNLWSNERYIITDMSQLSYPATSTVTGIVPTVTSVNCPTTSSRSYFLVKGI